MTFAEAIFRILGVVAIAGWSVQFLVWCERRPKRFNRVLDDPDRTLTMSPRWKAHEP